MNHRKTNRLLISLMLFVLAICVAVPSLATVKKGDSGSEVLKLQKALVAEGYSCNTNSKFTARTEKAVKQYQKDWDLTVDGVAGKATLVGLIGTTFVQGDVGPRIKEFQKLLKEAGYSVTVDGVYGKKTVSAVKQFQKDCGLTVDGRAGSETIAALKNGKGGYKTLRLGSTGTEVRRLQDALKTKGYYTGTINGVFNTATETAVKKFQKAKGITVDGIAGYKTLTLLYEGFIPIDPGKSSTVDSAYSLYYGCRGTRVYYLQKALKALGIYKGVLDSDYGELTTQAVKKYQQSHGLSADGIAGPKTIASINKNCKYKIPTSFILDIGIRGQEVTELTEFLVRKGYLQSTSNIYNDTVKAAVKVWQQESGKSVTGTITEEMYNRIVLGKEE